jgi:hypothetical protein
MHDHIGPRPAKQLYVLPRIGTALARLRGYALDVTTGLVNHGWDRYVEEAVTFDVITSNPLGFSWDFKNAYGYDALAMISAKALRFTPVGH